MANITITKTGELIDVDFGVYGDGDKVSTDSRYDTKDIIKVSLFTDYVLVSIRDEHNWYLVQTAHSNPSYMIIDKIDSSTPSSLSDLYSKLKALMV